MKQVGFIGAGRMAQALASGIAARWPAVRFVIVDPNPQAQAGFRDVVARARKGLGSKSDSRDVGPPRQELAGGSVQESQPQKINHEGESSGVDQDDVQVIVSAAALFANCEMVFLAVKPQFAVGALSGVDQSNPGERHMPLVISVMAGISIAKIRELTGGNKIVRVMPNTPCMVGQGASAIAVSEDVTTSELAAVRDVFQSVGAVEDVDESWLDAVTGLSGSGPAYVFAFVEALTRGGIAVGLPSELADRLARQTLLGAATMLMQPATTPEELRQQVTSPGGTTFAGLQQLVERGFDTAIIAAVEKAAARAGELGRDLAR